MQMYIIHQWLVVGGFFSGCGVGGGGGDGVVVVVLAVVRWGIRIVAGLLYLSVFLVGVVLVLVVVVGL